MAYNKETGMYEGYIYLILNDIYPEKIYVGQTTLTIKDRWYGHRRQIKNHSCTDKLHNLMSKYGVEHFAIEGIEKCIDLDKKELIEKLNKREKYYIDKFNTYYNGLNLTKGGRDGVEHSMQPVKRYDLYGNFIKLYDSVDELKSVFNFNCVSSIYSCCYGESKYAYGSIWRYKEDDLYKYKLPNKSEIKEAETRLNSTLPIDKYDYKGNFIKRFKNISEVVEIDKVDRNSVMKCCTGKSVYVGVYIYRFCKDEFNTYRTYREKPKLVEQYDLNGNFIAVYESVREAGRALGINYQNIVGVCNKKHKQSHGYIWRYVEDISENIVPDFKHNGHCKTIYQYDKNTFKLIEVYPSIKDASKITGINSNTIVSIANGKRDVVKSQYVWSYTELSIEEIKSKCRNIKSRKVSAYDINNIYLYTYDSGDYASKELNLGKNAKILIWSCCRGKAKTAYGYKWYYSDDPNQPDKTKIIV